MYKLTEVTNVTNAGSNSEVIEFDTFYELQDYICDKTADMTEEEKELYRYNSVIEEI